MAATYASAPVRGRRICFHPDAATASSPRGRRYSAGAWASAATPIIARCTCLRSTDVSQLGPIIAPPRTAPPILSPATADPQPGEPRRIRPCAQASTPISASGPRTSPATWRGNGAIQWENGHSRSTGVTDTAAATASR